MKSNEPYNKLIAFIDGDLCDKLTEEERDHIHHLLTNACINAKKQAKREARTGSFQPKGDNLCANIPSNTSHKKPNLVSSLLLTLRVKMTQLLNW